MRLAVAHGRSVKEWIGETPDTAIPDRVRLRVFDRSDGRCHRCERKIAAGETWTCEHLKALINGGENRETNLGVTCSWCLPVKNAEDVSEKADTYQKRRKHVLGRKAKGRGFRKPPGVRFNWDTGRYERDGR